MLAHLARKAFFPASRPFRCLALDSTWEFRALLDFRDEFARENGFRLIVHRNEEGRAAGINPFDHGDRYTYAMRTEPLKTALSAGGYDVIFGGARRDEERSRARRSGSFRYVISRGWNPRDQRPEFWRQYNIRLSPGHSARVFPLSNWTERDVWLYALQNKIELAPLYFSQSLPVVRRRGTLIAIDDKSRMRFEPGDRAMTRHVRFRTLGCWPVTGAIKSEASDISAVLEETERSRVSEREGRLADGEDGGSLEAKKQEGYF